jgi:flagellar basal-body rod protein FlgB
MTIQFSQFDLLSNAIEFARQNHTVISQNLANVNTPNYMAREMSLEKFLNATQNRSAAGRSSLSNSTAFEIQLTEGLATRSDGNNVDVDKELANLKRNDLMYQTLTQLIGSKLDVMKMAIRG